MNALRFLVAPVALTMLFAAAQGVAAGSVILSYSVQPWLDPFIPDCDPNYSVSSPACAIGSVGAYSNTLTLTTGVPQTAVLFPVVFTVPASGLFTNQSGPLLPMVTFTYTDTVSGANGQFQVQVPAQYSVLGGIAGVFEQLNPDDFVVLPGFKLRVDPFSPNLGPVTVGGITTYNAQAIFTTPIPLPEPSTRALLIMGALMAGIAARKQSLERT